jgi:hypothetical protein
MKTHFFWAYGNVGAAFEKCIMSFANRGFECSVWTYGNISDLPSELVKDAREIIPESSIFLNRQGSYAGFSDLFRYEVLSKIGGLYSDTDVVCLTRPDDLPLSPFLVTEKNGNAVQINGNVVFNPVPEEGNLISLAQAYAEKFPKDKISWAEIGPWLLTGLVTMNPNHGFTIYAPEFANPIGWQESPGRFLSECEIPVGAKFVHLYNETWRRCNMDISAKYPESFLISKLLK